MTNSFISLQASLPKAPMIGPCCRACQPIVQSTMHPAAGRPARESAAPTHGGRQAPAAEATQRLSLAPGMRHRGRAAGRAAEGLRLRLWVGCGYHQTQA